MKYFPLAAALALVAFFTRCADAPTDLGADITGANPVVRSYDSRASQTPVSSTMFAESQTLGFAQRLLLGEHDGVSSQILINFRFYFDDAELAAIEQDSMEVRSAKIVLYHNYYYPDSLASFLGENVAGYEVLERWTPLSATPDSMPALGARNLITDFERNDSQFVFTVDPELARTWMRSQADTNYKNYGIALTPTGETETIVGFQAFNMALSTTPKLLLDARNHLTDADSLYEPKSDFDAHVLEAPAPSAPAGDRLTAQASVVGYATLSFDLADLIEYSDDGTFSNGVVINQATLTLTRDSLNSAIFDPGMDALAAWAITDTGETIEIDEDTYSGLPRDGDIYSGDVSQIVRHWFDNGTFTGMRVGLRDPLEGLDKITFYDFDADSAFTPRLTITYSTRW
ncbi:MAG: hypothetical protein GF419_10660 [Ignavibacteriales bacterium]|nr:hypothetical protein [Ignavibacteriales bacterium]